MPALTRFIGLMSGTSLDGVDGVLARLGTDGRIQVENHAFLAFEAPLRKALFDLNQSADNELHRAALAANALARCYADVVQQLWGPRSDRATPTSAA